MSSILNRLQTVRIIFRNPKIMSQHALSFQVEIKFLWSMTLKTKMILPSLPHSSQPSHLLKSLRGLTSFLLLNKKLRRKRIGLSQRRFQVCQTGQLFSSLLSQFSSFSSVVMFSSWWRETNQSRLYKSGLSYVSSLLLNQRVLIFPMTSKSA